MFPAIVRVFGSIRQFSELGVFHTESLRRAIEREGIGLGTDIVKVDMFLNHRLDTALLFEMGEVIADHFRKEQPDIILTVEASGIALALTAAHKLGNIPVVFAKKKPAANQSDDQYSAPVFSFTHKTLNHVRVDKKYLPRGSRVLIVDDFLANGGAVNGLTDICGQAGCTVVGVSVGVEKGFQDGGRELRAKGVNLLSLAIVDGIDDGVLRLRDEEQSFK